MDLYEIVCGGLTNCQTKLRVLNSLYSPNLISKANCEREPFEKVHKSGHTSLGPIVSHIYELVNTRKNSEYHK